MTSIVAVQAAFGVEHSRGVDPTLSHFQNYYTCREQQFDDARQVFAIATAQQPDEEIAWVSWAQVRTMLCLRPVNQATARRYHHTAVTSHIHMGSFGLSADGEAD